MTVVVALLAGAYLRHAQLKAECAGRQSFARKPFSNIPLSLRAKTPPVVVAYFPHQNRTRSWRLVVFSLVFRGSSTSAKLFRWPRCRRADLEKDRVSAADQLDTEIAASFR